MREQDIKHKVALIHEILKKVEILMDTVNIPQGIKDSLKNSIFKSAELEELLDSIEHYEIPRIMMVGRTGVGKSSLLNAICGSYLAEVSDVVVGTKEVQKYHYTSQGRPLLEILDSRGIGESIPSGSQSAEEVLIKEIRDFSPNLILLVLRCKARDRIDQDVKYVAKLKRRYLKRTGMDLPIITVLTQADEMEPSVEKNPEFYSEGKIENLQCAENYVKEILEENGIDETERVISVSALVLWALEDGKILTSRQMNELSEEQRQGLMLIEDYRYHISELMDMMMQCVDKKTAMGLQMASGEKIVLERIAQMFVNTFSVIASAVAVSPIPVSDLYILWILQACLVMIIAGLAGEDLDFKGVKKFFTNLGIVGLTGIGGRSLAQQSAKLINFFGLPLAGSAVSSVIAAQGTRAIGKAAINYYLHDYSSKEIRQNAKKMRKVHKEKYK